MSLGDEMSEQGWPRNERRVASDERIEKLEKLILYGNGKPGLTARMELVETWQKDMQYMFRKIIWLLLGTFGTGLVTLIVTLILHH